MLAELEKQRSAILSLLQRGKDLSRELNAPEFLKEDVRNLEKKWNTSYGSAMDRLKRLRETEKVNYNMAIKIKIALY